MCGSGRWLRTRGVKQSQSASRVASAAPASRVESKRQPSLKRIQNHPRAHSIRTSRSVPNLGIVARPIRAIRSARASSSVLLRPRGKESLLRARVVDPSRPPPSPSLARTSVNNRFFGNNFAISGGNTTCLRSRARAVVSSVSQRSFRRVSFRSFPASPVVVVAVARGAAPVLVHVVVVFFAVLNLRHRARGVRSRGSVCGTSDSSL